MSYLVQSLKNAPVSTAQSIADTAARDAAIAASTPASHVGSGGAAHALATTSAAGFLGASDKVKLDAITGTNTGDETQATIKSKLGITTLSGANTGDQTSITGSAGTADRLTTPRTINGVAFDGSANIVILPNVDNTSDINKPVSTAQAAADAAVQAVAASDATAKANARQATLVSGTNIRTINGNSLLGAGDLAVSGGAVTATLVRSTRTSNTVLGTADASRIISMTGTYTQTFDTAAALGSGWFCYLRNNGIGDITLGPSGSELIDGLSGYIMYPGETRLIQCDGLALSSIIIQAFTKTFTGSGTFNKPPGYLQFSGLLWAGGGGGAMNNNGTGSGGGGGACHPFLIPSASLSAAQSVIIGAGGAGATTSGGYGAVGGTSTFGPINSYGGGGGYGLDNSYGGGGGGIMSAGSSSAGGKPSIYPQSNANLDNHGFGGGGIIFYSGSSSFAGSSVYGGASSGVGAMGSSVYGGGAGGAAGRVGSSSVYGGAGGNASTTGAGSPGADPAGGGGHGKYTAGGAGGRGEMRIWGVM